MRLIIILLFCSTTIFADAQNWFPVGSGINFGRAELFSFKDKLFVGGNFNRIDGKSARGTAYWDKKKWNPFSSNGVNFTSVRSFATYQDELYAFGGNYPSPEYGGIIKYDESENTWTGLPNSKVSVYVGNGNYGSGRVDHAIEFKNELYIAGNFDFIGDQPAKNIAKWNGLEWSQVLTNAGHEVYVQNISTFEIFENALIMCGSIDNMNFETYRGIASYNGETWSNLDGGIIANATSPGASSILDLAVYKGELYAAGRSSTIPGDDKAYNVVKWNGNNWAGVEGFEYDGLHISTLKNFSNYLVIGGDSFQWVAYLYNGTTTKKIEQEFNHSITNFAEFNKQLFAGSGVGPDPSINGISRLGNIAINQETKSKCNVFPNPTNGEFMIGYETLVNTKTIISFFTASGILVKEEIFNDLKGVYLRRFNLENFPVGIYAVKIQSKEINESKIIVKN